MCVGTLQLVGLLLLLRGVAIGARLTECWLCCATVSVVLSRCGPRFLLLFSAALMVDLARYLAGLFLRRALCQPDCGIVSMGLPGVATRQALDETRLSPAAAGLFRANPVRRATNGAARR